MNVSEAIQLLFKKSGAKKKDIAAGMGYKSPTIINNAMARENLTVDFLIRMCNALNYEVVIRPSAASKSEVDIILDTPKKEGVRQ